MNIVVLTPEKEVYTGEAKAVNVPGTSGQFEVLNGHAPIVSSLMTGKVKLTLVDDSIKTFAIDRGFIEVLRNEVSLLVQGYVEE
jgi:F-type H+-transporting ATPase subunit epsilon